MDILPSRQHHRAAIALLLAAVAFTGCQDRAPELLEVPRPETASFEPAVQEQLATAFRRLDEPAGDAARRATDFGELARILHAYELRDAAEAAYRNAHSLAPSSHRWAYLLGVALQEQGQLEAAVGAFERATELDPEDLPTRIRLAHTLLDTNRLEQARRHLDAALELDPECALAHYFLGQVELAGERFAAAIASLGNALGLEPGANRVYHALGRAYRGAGDLQRAATALEKAGSREVHLDDPLFRALDELEISSAGYIRRAGRAQLAGAVDAAIEEYRRAIDAAPTNAEARAGLGATLAELGRLDEAREHLEVALRHGGDNAGVLYNMAGVHRLAGHPAAAIDSYRRALELDPDYLDARIGLAQVLGASGNRAEAVAMLEQGLEHGGQTARVHLELAAMHLLAGDRGAARRHQQAVLQADPTPRQKARVHRQRAETALGGGDAEAALAEYEHALDADSSDLESRFARANLLGAGGRFEAAAVDYREVIERAPGHLGARLGEATALTLAGEHAAAARRLAEGLGRFPDDPQLSHALARLLIETPDPALRSAEKALELVQRASRQGGSIEMAETQAMALAELGRLAEAIELQGRVVQELRRVGRGERVPAATARLEAYRRRQGAR